MQLGLAGPAETIHLHPELVEIVPPPAYANETSILWQPGEMLFDFGDRDSAGVQ